MFTPDISNIALYIDPGTGSMLFAALIGVFSTVLFFLRKLFMKLKYSGIGAKDPAQTKKTHDIVLFSEGRQYVKSFEGIVDELEKRGVSATYVTMDENDAILKKDLKHIECICPGNSVKTFTYLNNLSAEKLLSTTPGLDVYQWKRSPDVGEYIHFYHAMAPTGYRLFGLDFYDTVLTVGDYQDEYLRELEDMRGIRNKKLVPVGCTYMDVLAEQIRNRKAEKIFDNGNKTIIWAPSWGDSSSLRNHKVILEALLRSSYNVIVRPHPQSFKVETEIIDEIRKERSSHENLYLDEDPDNFRALSTADLLISDFSSITFDFMFCFGKPVILTNTEYDLSPYDAYWSKKEHWLTKTVGELGYRIDVDKLSEIGSYVDRLLKDEEKKRLREEYKKRLWTNQGSSAAKIADYLTSGKRV